MRTTRLSIDKTKLMRDALQSEKDRPLPSVGRETVGIVRVIRDLLPTVKEMRAKKIRWAAIAEALNKQGVHPEMEGEADTLTTNRLTAIVSALERQEVNRQTRAIMCFASPKERACYSHNSVEMTPFRENVLGTVFGKAACSEGSSLVAVAAVPVPGSFSGKQHRQC